MTARISAGGREARHARASATVSAHLVDALGLPDLHVGVGARLPPRVVRLAQVLVVVLGGSHAVPHNFARGAKWCEGHAVLMSRRRKTACTFRTMTTLRPLGLLERWYSTTFSQFNVLVSFTLSLRAAPQHLPTKAELVAAIVGCLPHFPQLALAIHDDDKAPIWLALSTAAVEAQAPDFVSVVLREGADTAMRMLEARQQDRRGIVQDGTTVLWSAVAVLPDATAGDEAADFEIVLSLHHGVFDGARDALSRCTSHSARRASRGAAVR